jgi:hypothetical protein
MKLSGTLRARAEAIDGQVRPGFAPAELMLVSRATLRAELGDGPVTVLAELWDSRAFAIEPGSVLSTNEVNTLELVQAHVRVKLSPAATLTAGRMTLNLGSRRLIAADDYRNTTNGSTGLKLELGQAKRPQATLFAVLPQQRLPDDFDSLKRGDVQRDRESFDLWAAGAVVTVPGLPAGAALEGSWVHLNEDDGRRPTRDRKLDTLGLRAWREPAPGKADFDVEAFGQWGRISATTAANAASIDVRAWALHAEAGYSFEGQWRPRLALEYDFASGDDRGPAWRRFDTLFGMRRAEIAPSGLYNAVGRANLSAPGIRVEITPSRRTDAFATFKMLWAASGTDSFSTSGVRDPTGGSGRYAGEQIDMRVRHWILPGRLRAEANGVLLIRRGLLQTAPNAPDGRTTAYGAMSLTGSF